MVKKPPRHHGGKIGTAAGFATTFADAADVASFRRCKAEGMTDREAFRWGDNGIGCWGDDTTAPRPMCALPPEDIVAKWGSMKAKDARGRRVVVETESARVVCELRDRMPAKARITNGAVIDLNPAATSALGYQPPARFKASWHWACDE